MNNRVYMVRRKDDKQFMVDEYGRGGDVLKGRIFKKKGHIKLSPLSRKLYRTLDDKSNIKLVDPNYEIVGFDLIESEVISLYDFYSKTKKSK